MNNRNSETGLNISVKSFITAIIVILVLMVVSYALTFIVPSGEYARMTNEAGQEIIDAARGFQYVESNFPFWKWLLSPILVLTGNGSGTIIAVIIFLLVIGGAFNALDKSGIMSHLLNRITERFGKTRYHLLTVAILFFMGMGALVGTFEEIVPLVPIVVALAIRLGWDSVTGMAMSLLAAGCGFASGVMNPFSVGVAQSLAGVPMFSGIWLRLVSFVLIFLLLLFFVRSYAGTIERPVAAFALPGTTEGDAAASAGGCEPEGSADADPLPGNDTKDQALKTFVAILGIGILLILASTFISALQDFTMIIVAVMFLIAGIAAPVVAGVKGDRLLKIFISGATSIFPAVLLILMASSIRYTLEEAKIMDTILYGAVGIADILPKWTVILFIYLIVLAMNFFIGSGSAKAFMLIPLIVPLAQIFGISAQLCIVAFAFGDGFSNVFYPTNPVLLISLGLADISYSKWAKWSAGFQIANLFLTSALLLFGLAVGY